MNVLDSLISSVGCKVDAAYCLLVMFCGRCVCALDTLVRPAKTDEPIEIQCGFSGPEKPLLDGARSTHEKAHLRGSCSGIPRPAAVDMLSVFRKASAAPCDHSLPLTYPLVVVVDAGTA